MRYKTIHLVLVADEEQLAHSVADCAISFCEREDAHLSVHLAAPILDVPSGRLVPLVHAVLDQVNDTIRSSEDETVSAFLTSHAVENIITDNDPNNNMFCEILNCPLTAGAKHI